MPSADKSCHGMTNCAGMIIAPLFLRYFNMAKWDSPTPTNCQLCKNTLANTFIDGKVAFGGWAIMCEECHKQFGSGLGLGKGQKYHLDTLEKIGMKIYVGDSVYAEWNPDLYGEHLVLTTENGLPSDPSNTILLGPQELQNLIEWAKGMGWKI